MTEIIPGVVYHFMGYSVSNASFIIGEKTIALMGGRESVLSAISQALNNKEPQWAVELTDILIAADSTDKQAKYYKAQGLISLAHLEQSANGRHYYLACAKELAD